MNINIDKIKLIIVYILLFIMFILLLVGVIYAVKNYDAGERFEIKNFDPTITINEDQLDTVNQPTPGLPIIYTNLPKTSDTITSVNLKTFKKLFQTSQKSIVYLTKDECSHCEAYKPLLIQVLEDNGLFAYEININKLSAKDKKDLANYIDYDGFPTTYVIRNGKATHSLTGTVDKDTLQAYIDYFYIREN